MYVILEAHHRFDNDAVVDLLSLIGKVYIHHPTLMTAVSHPDIASIAQITLAAWQKHHTYAQQQYQQRHDTRLLNESELPVWVQELQRKFDLPEVNPEPAPDRVVRESAIGASQLLPLDFDFDSINWSFWENLHMDTAMYDMN